MVDLGNLSCISEPLDVRVMTDGPFLYRGGLFHLTRRGVKLSQIHEAHFFYFCKLWVDSGSKSMPCANKPNTQMNNLRGDLL